MGEKGYIKLKIDNSNWSLKKSSYSLFVTFFSPFLCFLYFFLFKRALIKKAMNPTKRYREQCHHGQLLCPHNHYLPRKQEYMKPQIQPQTSNVIDEYHRFLNAIIDYELPIPLMLQQRNFIENNLKADPQKTPLRRILV